MNRLATAALLATTCLVTTGAIAADAPKPTADSITGVVTSAKGPEAGVWVIAETTDLPTRMIKEVVTDDQGRYVLPDLPKAKYTVWVRGYGLVDSKQIKDVQPGKSLNLKAVIAPDAKSAAEYYPANYWFALIKPPADSEYPGTGAEGNGIAPKIKNSQQFMSELKEGCGHCHQVGDKSTRELADNSVAGWAERIKMARPAGDQAVGNNGPQFSAGMQNVFATLGSNRTLKMYAEWTDRIGKGALPVDIPPRPEGIERNVVITVWDWANGRFVHDVSVTDRRDPTKNAYGPIFSGATLTGALEMFDPKTHTPTEVGYGVVTDQAGNFTSVTPEHNLDMGPHNPMVDQKGRVWLADMGRARAPIAKPDFCSNEQTNKFAKYFPAPGKSASMIVMYDPKTKKLEGTASCFFAHHLMFGRDTNDTLYFSSPGGELVGWLDTKVWDETHDVTKAQGWCPMVLDTKEKGATKVALSDGGPTVTPDRKNWNQPGQPMDPKKDTRISGGHYGIDVNPVDGSIWFVSQSDPYPSTLLRFEKGSNPPETCRVEKYQPPKLPNGDYAAIDGRGVSVDGKGVAWISFSSGQMGKFDRSKCKVLNGPTATGQQCPEGWSFYDITGPKIAGTNYAADWHYLTWVDLYNTSGLGKDIPWTPGTWSDSMIGVMPDTGKTIHLRVPYPLGFYGRGVDGRIDDANAGWKGRGLWSTYAMVPVWHQEGGAEGAGPQLVHFQMRPDPLAQ